MEKVIETNISINFGTNEVIDTQSRVIEIEDWENYKREILNGEIKEARTIINHLSGYSVSPKAKILKVIKNDKYYFIIKAQTVMSTNILSSTLVK